MKYALLALAVASILVAPLGCKKPDPVDDPQFMQKRQEAGTLAREMFTKSSGNFDSLSAEDKQQLLAAFDNDENRVRQVFQQIANPTYGPTFSGQAPAPAPPQAPSGK